MFSCVPIIVLVGTVTHIVYAAVRYHWNILTYEKTH